MSNLGIFNYVDHISVFFLNFTHLFVTVFVRPGFVCLRSSLSNTDLILHTYITSAGSNYDSMLSLSVIQYHWRNCCRAFPVGVPLTFFVALFSVSTKLSACCWTLDDMRRSWYDWSGRFTQTSLKSPDVNCVPLSDTRQSITPNLANTSAKLIVTSVVGFLHLRTSGHFEKNIYNY